jgi:hypothetical protein
VKTLHLFVFADALGWRLANHYTALAGLAPVRRPCQTMFGYSSTCDPTILTGALPQAHQHFSFFVRAERGASPFGACRYLAWLPQRLAGYHRVRNRISRWFAAHRGYTGYFQLYSVPFGCLPYLDYTEKRDIYEPGGIIGGQASIFQIWQGSGKPWHRSDWRVGDEANMHEAETVIQAGAVELMYLFTSGLDAVMHRYGPWAPQTATAIQAFENRLERILSSAHTRYDRVRLAVFSDHGMAEVTQVSDMRLRFERWCTAAALRYGRDYVAVWDSTMARFWFETPAARQAITGWLAQQADGTLLSDQQLSDWHCLFADRRYGEVFYLLPPGHLFVPSYLNQSRVPGMHGYAPEDRDSVAAWLANFDDGPAVNRLDDIFKAMTYAAES